MGVLPGGKGGRGDNNQLYIRNLPSDTSDIDLRDIFAPFGAIPAKGVKAMLNEDGMCTGIGFVDFLNDACAMRAKNALHGAMLMDGTTLQVYIKNTPKARAAAKEDAKKPGMSTALALF